MTRPRTRPRPRTRVLVLALALVSLAAACSTSQSGDDWRGYSGPEELKWPLRAEIERQVQRIGRPKDEARKFRLTVRRCAESARDKHGEGYTCDRACSGHDQCVFATCGAASGAWRGDFMFVGMPSDDTLRHEVGHLILGHYAGIYGHPATAVVNGRTINVRRDLIGGATWAKVAAWLPWVDPPSTNWSRPGCAHGDGTHWLVEGIEPGGGAL